MTDPKTKDLHAYVRENVKKYKDVYPNYKEYAKLLDRVLSDGKKRLAPLGIVQTRPKSIPSFAEKIVRKRELYTDPIHQMTDLCGGRIICRTRSEVDSFCHYLEANFNIDLENSMDISKRLSPTEFGYRSIHYIVTFRKDKKYVEAIPDTILGLKAEVQVRTMVEHAWADFAHDLSYKGAFDIPAEWKRELAGIAASLEEVDKAFAAIEQRLTRYSTSFGAYLSERKIRDELDKLETILKHDPGNADLIARMGKMANTLGDWNRAIVILEPHVKPEDPGATHPPILHELGIAKCKLQSENPYGAEYRQGQEYLELASAANPKNVDTLGTLAGTWKGIDEARAGELYRKAFEIDSSDPYVLGNHLERELEHETSIPSVARPLLRDGVERCEGHISVGINLPWAFFDLGKFLLMLGKEYESLEAYAKAISTSTAPYMIERSLDSLEKFAGVAGNMPGYEWIRRLLLLGLASRFSSEMAMSRITNMASTGCSKIRPPVAIVAGGTDPQIDAEMKRYREMLLEAFAGFEGTIISGGTTAGICGVVGDIGQAYSKRIHTIGYLPLLIPTDATVDTDTKRYRELRKTKGKDFSALEPLQNWIDLAASGVPLSSVRLVGINGGKIAAAEYNIALALGAYVGLIEQSGREAGRLLTDKQWAETMTLVKLPEDGPTVRAFVGTHVTPLPEGMREKIGQRIHEDYRAARKAGELFDDPSMADWEKLKDDLKESNLQQADHIVEKLREIGCTIEDAGKGAGEPFPMSDEEVKTLARIEHGRWNTERLLAGWSWGPTKDDPRKQSPYLVAWEDLDEKIKKLDLEAVRNIPKLLAEVGLKIRRNA